MIFQKSVKKKALTTYQNILEIYTGYLTELHSLLRTVTISTSDN